MVPGRGILHVSGASRILADLSRTSPSITDESYRGALP